MDKKFDISDKVAAITYKGCVTIEYFDIVKGKKIINAYNEGTYNLFDSLAKALRKDTFTIPDSIMLYKGSDDTDNILNSPVHYTVTPLLYNQLFSVGSVVTTSFFLSPLESFSPSEVYQ